MLLAAEETQTTVAKRFSLVLDYYYPLLKEKFDDWDVRLKDLEALQDIALRYVFISDFLADFAITFFFAIFGQRFRGRLFRKHGIEVKNFA